MPSSRGGTWPQGPCHAGQEASCACAILGLGNSPLLAAQGLNTTRQLTIKHKEQTRQQPVWIKEINAYKNALSPWKKGDAKHEASFPRLGSPSDGSEPHNGDGGGDGQGPPLRASCEEGGGHQHPDSRGRSCRHHADHKAEGGQLRPCVCGPVSLRAPVSMGGPQGLRVRPGTLRTGPWPTTVDRCGSPACGVRVALVGLWVGQGLTQEETGAQSRYIRPGREWTPCEKTVPQTDAVPWLPGGTGGKR